MSKNINNKKFLAERIKDKLNSPEYVAMSDLITYDDRHGDMLNWLWGNKIDYNIHKNENWIGGTNINPGKGNKHESEHIVCYDELEKDDWEEIVNLIEKRNKEKEQIYDQKLAQIKEKLNNTPGLYYRFSKTKRLSFGYFTYPDKHGKYFGILGHENGREFYLNINKNHPVLSNFPFQKNGYYLIETDKLIERNDEFDRPWSDGGETNPSNFHKWVEVGDKITITPFEIREKTIEKPKSSELIDNGNDEVINYGNSNSEKKSLTKSSEQEIISSEIAKYLLQFIQDNDIKEIRVENGELIVEYNKNISSAEQSNNSQELQLAKSIIQKSDNQKLTKEKLSKWANNTSTMPTNKTSNNNNVLWLGIGGMLVLTIGIVVGLLLNKKDKKRYFFL